MSTIEEEIKTLEMEFEEVIQLSTDENFQTSVESVLLEKKYWKDKCRTQIMKALHEYIESEGVNGQTES